MNMPPTKELTTTANGPATGEVLTLAEAAAYLRLPEADVVSAIHAQGLPGQLVGGEWRLLKDAVRHWLGKGLPTAETRKAAQLATVGSWTDDPYLEEMLKDIYRKRGRPMVEEGG
jgi:excisionase family DNA binding protein